MRLRTLVVAVAVLVFVAVQSANATTYVVRDTTISVFAQSTPESSVNLIKLSKGMYNNGAHPWCGNRAYISFDNKELYATALAAALANRTVNVIYEDNAPRETAAGHVCFSCKVLSIWWD